MKSFTDLILLIGTNPLPDYVVADFFLNHIKNDRNLLKRIWMIHSKKTEFQVGTCEQAKSIKRLLKGRHTEVDFQMVELSDVSSAKTITNEIVHFLLKSDLLSEKSKVHLNYTGGTKVMGTHVYRTIEQDRSLKIAEKSYSYLDGRQFRLVSDDDTIIADNLLDKVKISFNELISLHGYERKNKDSDHDYTDSIEVFIKLIDENRLCEYYDIENNGYDRSYFLSTKKPETLAAKRGELDCTILSNYKPNTAVMEVIQAMEEKYRLFDANGEFDMEIICNKREWAPVKQAIKFLDGMWLEDYLHCVLTDHFTGYEVLKNWEIKRSSYDFELDVILIKGYQLTGISCTTSTVKSECKKRGFEIIHRTKQIGGDEARAVLATRVKEDTRKKLQDELELDTGSASFNILVLGEDDLKASELTDKIEEFLLNKFL